MGIGHALTNPNINTVLIFHREEIESNLQGVVSELL
jgi:hypothetical protein